MNTMPAGWYPDPSGDWQVRYWDGSVWTQHVQTGQFQAVDVLEPPTLPEVESLLWQSGEEHLTTHRAVLRDTFAGSKLVTVMLWTVARVEVRPTHELPAPGTGEVALVVAYRGYGGRTHWILKNVPDPHRVGALAWKWANRNRRTYLPQG